MLKWIDVMFEKIHMPIYGCMKEVHVTFRCNRNFKKLAHIKEIHNVLVFIRTRFGNYWAYQKAWHPD